MELKTYSKKVARATLTGTKWENLLHFWETGDYLQFIVFSKEIQVKKLIQLDKKTPDLILLGKC